MVSIKAVKEVIAVLKQTPQGFDIGFPVKGCKTLAVSNSTADSLCRAKYTVQSKEHNGNDKIIANEWHNHDYPDIKVIAIKKEHIALFKKADKIKNYAFHVPYKIDKDKNIKLTLK